MSNTIPPSEEARQQLRAFLGEGIQTSVQPSSELLRLAAQVVVQEILEQEETDFLGRERYARRARLSFSNHHLSFLCGLRRNE